MTRASGRLRAVFDCNTLVQAIAFEGPADACVRLVEAGVVELFVSRWTISELRRVLTYERVLASSPHMTPARIAAFLKRLSFRSTIVRRVPHIFDYPRDTKDEPYVDLAVAAEADYLVSRDKDLLSLMTGHSLICKKFRRRTHPLRVVNPEDFLKAAAL